MLKSLFGFLFGKKKPTPSEDASAILSTSRLNFAPIPPASGPEEYKPLPGLHWIIEITPAAGTIFRKEDLWDLFDKDWQMKYKGFELFGRSSKDKRWTYVITFDSPGSYDQLQVTLQLTERYSPGNREWDAPILEGFLQALRQRLTSKFGDITIRETEDIPAAIKKAQQLTDLKKQFGGRTIIVLKSHSFYSEKMAWDALTSVGLQWGDENYFHWNPTDDDPLYELFSVWSSTPPGYFFPEDDQLGTKDPADLKFGFEVPRSIDPVNIFDAMADAAEYCQKKLGGTLLTTEGLPFDRHAEKKVIAKLTDEMKARGIPPGSPLTLRLF